MSDSQPSKRPAAEIAAHIVSDLFSPLLAPTYAMIAAMWLTRLHYLPLGVRIWSTLGVTCITALVPLIVISVLIRMGRVSDRCISDPRQRTLPYVVSILCYLGAGAFLLSLKAPAWLPAFFGGAAVVSFLSLLITYKWKISAHTGGMGGLAAVIYWLAYHGYIESMPLIWVSAAFLLTGIMAWARLYLRHHTLMQTFAGAVMSFATVYIIISLV